MENTVLDISLNYAAQCMLTRWVINRSQPFYTEEHQKYLFVHLCIFIWSLLWTQGFTRKYFKGSYSLSVCIGWTSQHLFISVNPSVPKKYTAVHQCTQSRHASNDFSYPCLSPRLLLLILSRYNISTVLWQGINSCIKVHKQDHLKIINTDCEIQEFTLEYMFTQITPELQNKYFP